MNGRERVFAALAGEAVDRRPFTAMLSLYGARLTRCHLPRYYSVADAYLEGQGAVLHAFQPDILFSSFALVAMAEAFGSRVRYFDNQAPNLLEPAAVTPENLCRLSVPDINSHPRLLYIRETIRGLKERYGRDVAVIGILLSPVDFPILLMGVEKWLETVLFDPAGTQRVLDVTTPFFIRFANAMLQDGADALALPLAFLTPAIVTRNMAESFTLPVLREAFQSVNGPILLHHVGGPFLKFLDLFCELPQVVGVVMGVDDDLNEARRIVGPGKTLICGPHGPTLDKKTPDQITRDCENILNRQISEPCFMIATTGADVAFNTPVSHILAIQSSVEQFPYDE